MAESFIPPEVAGSILPQLNFDYAVKDGYLSIGI